MVRELRHVVQVGRDAAHQLADLGVVVVGVLQHLQMGEHVPAHVGFNLRAHAVTDGLHVIIGRRVDHAQKHVHAAHRQNQANRERGNVRRRALGDFAHDHRQHQLAQRGHRRAEQVEQHDLHVRLEVRREFSREVQISVFRALHAFPPISRSMSGVCALC